jgi:ethanolamine-phosphate cytidylyltransferase
MLANAILLVLGAATTFIISKKKIQKKKIQGKTRKEMQKKKKRQRVYMDGCFDLMHFGHANALRQARQTGTELVVGLVSDEEILRCKGPPVLNACERVKCVKAVKWVDDVIEDVPYELHPEFVERLFTEYGIDFIVHGDDPCLLPDGTDAYEIPKRLGKYREIKRTEGVSTTDLVARLLEFADMNSSNNESDKSDFDFGGKHVEDNEKSGKNPVVVQKRHEARFCTTASRIAQFAAKVEYSATSKINNEDINRKMNYINHDNKVKSCCYVVGVFDVFNAGHVEMLEECQQLSQKVICAVIADEYLSFEQTNKPLPLLNQSERAMSVIACRHCDDVVVGAPARVTDDICKTFNVTTVVFEDEASVTEEDRMVCKRNNAKIETVSEKTFSRKKITIAKRVQENRALFEARQKRKMASEAAYYEQKAFVQEE